MRSFGSDNNSGIHPLILEAICAVNVDHEPGYGADKYTAKADRVLCDVFGPTAEPFYVFNGTGANCVAVQAAVQAYNSVISAATGHIHVDECGAMAFTIETPDGKLTPELIIPKLQGFGNVHHAQPKVIYITQATELGTVYRVEEIQALADLAHRNDMYLIMDGARLANACVTLNKTMRELTVDAGVDILSLGGTKNGMMLGEAVISFHPELSKALPFFRKQSAQLYSKMRYLSAQYIPYFTTDLWIKNATHANRMTLLLEEAFRSLPECRICYPVESNEIFLQLPQELIDKLHKDFFFYDWDTYNRVIRFVCSWDTTEEDIQSLISFVKSNI